MGTIRLLKLLSLKFLNFVGMFLFWYGCILKAGYISDNTFSIPGGYVSHWVLAAVAIYIGSSNQVDEKESSPSSSKRFERAKGLLVNSGLLIFTFSAIYVVSFGFFVKIPLNEAVKLSFIAMTCSLIILFIYEMLDLGGRFLNDSNKKLRG
jgi:hypothetical protein